MNSIKPVNAGSVPTAPPRTGRGIAAMASPSERAKTERASRISAREDDGGEGIRIDIAAGSVYLAIVPWRDPMDKRPPIRRFRNRTYSPPSSGLSGRQSSGCKCRLGYPLGFDRDRDA